MTLWWLRSIWVANFLLVAGMPKIKDPAALCDPGLDAHIAGCKDANCQCSQFKRLFFTLASSLLLPNGNSWLWFSVSAKCSQSSSEEYMSQFRWRCLVCHGEGDTHGQARPGSDAKHGGRLLLCNLRHHENGDGHQRRVRRAMADKDEDDVEVISPSVELYKSLLEQFQGGRSPSQGYWCNGVFIGERKAIMMLYTLAEAVKQFHQEKVACATSMTLLRDERHARLHMRFRCCNDAMETYHGFLGQARDAEQSAIELTASTIKALKSFCTSFEDPPPGMFEGTGPVFHERLFNHACYIAEAVSCDSASNEVVAAWDMKNWTSAGLSSDLAACRLFPNLRFVLRDASHAARRVLSRPWKACPSLGKLMLLFVIGRNSLVQKINNSLDLRREYAACSTACAAEAPTSSVFTHLSAAKHRYESFASPLSKLVLGIEAMVMFACRLAAKRPRSADALHGAIFLLALTPLVLVLLGMMADAAAESLAFVRNLDDENARGGIVEISALVASYRERIWWLFGPDEGVLQVPGHTQWIREWLRKPHFWAAGSRSGCIGGCEVEGKTLEQGFAFMRAWLKLANMVLILFFNHATIKRAKLRKYVRTDGLLFRHDVKKNKKTKNDLPENLIIFELEPKNLNYISGKREFKTQIAKPY